MWLVLGVMLQAVQNHPAGHVRQAKVERDGIGVRRLRQLERHLAPRGDQALEAELVGHLQQDRGEPGVVLHDQEEPVPRLEVVAVPPDVHLREGRRARGAAGIGRGTGVDARGGVDGAPAVAGVRQLGRRRRRRLVGGRQIGQRQVQCEGAPLAGRALHADLAAQQAGDLPADRQPQARPAVHAAGPRVGLLERLEDDLQLVRGDADAGVADGKSHDAAGAAEHGVVDRPAVRGQLDPHVDATGLGELAGVRKQVSQHLLESPGVGGDRGRQAGGQLDRERQALGLGHRAERALDVFPEVRERVVRDFDRHRPRLDLGHVEDVVDQREQVRARRVDRLGELFLLRRQVPLGVFREHLRRGSAGC